MKKKKKKKNEKLPNHLLKYTEDFGYGTDVRGKIYYSNKKNKKKHEHQTRSLEQLGGLMKAKVRKVSNAVSFINRMNTNSF